MHQSTGLVLFALSVSLASPPAFASTYDGLLVPESRFQELRGQSDKWKSLRKRCDQELAQAPNAVANFQPEPHYTSSGVGHDDSARYLNIDAGVAYRAAVCYQLTGELTYATHTQRIADAWGSTLKQVGKGQGAAEINFNMPQLIVAASWVRQVQNWDDSSFRKMLVAVALPTTHSRHDNNHGNWGVLLDATVAAYIGDEAAQDRAKARWQALMLSQVADDGSLPSEICRSNTNNFCDGADKGVNGISYTHYTLLPTALAAEIFHQKGQNLYTTAAGKRLQLAFFKASEWTLHPERFPFYLSNHGALNGVHNAAYFHILKHRYENPAAQEVIAQGKLGMNGFELSLLMD